MWTIFLKVFIKFIMILLLIYILVFFFPQGTWNLSSLTRDKTASPALEGKVLIIEPPQKS